MHGILRLADLRCSSISNASKPESWLQRPNFLDGVSIYTANDVVYLPMIGAGLPICAHFVPVEAIGFPLWLEIIRPKLRNQNVDTDTCHFAEEEVVFLGNIYSLVFGHWMEQLLKVVAFEEFGFEGFYVVPKTLPKYCRESLELLGITSDRLYVAEQPTIFSKAYFSTNINKFNASPSAIKALRDKLFEAAGDSKVSPPRIWVDRGTNATPGRDLVNPEEVYSYISRHGFERVDFAALDISSQIQIDKQTKVLAGVHGSAMVHCGFMKDHGHVIEAFSPNFIHPSVLHICLALQHQYHQLVHANQYEATYTHERRVLIDMKHLRLVIDGINRNDR